MKNVRQALPCITRKGEDFITLLAHEFFEVHCCPTVSRLGLRCPTRPEDFLGVCC